MIELMKSLIKPRQTTIYIYIYIYIERERERELRAQGHKLLG